MCSPFLLATSSFAFRNTLMGPFFHWNKLLIDVFSYLFPLTNDLSDIIICKKKKRSGIALNTKKLI